MTVLENKQDLRARLRHSRKEYGAAVGSEKSLEAARAAARVALRLSVFERAQTVALYAARGFELDPIILAERLLATAVIGYPRIENKTPPTLSFRVSRPSDLVPGAFDLLEPSASARVMPPVDVFVVPGLGFDDKGRRLGQGGGYYDAALQATPEAVRVGFAYDVQLVSEIPVEDHDEPMDYVVTPTRYLATSARGFVADLAKEVLS